MENTNTSSPVASSFTKDEWQNDCLLSLLPCTHQELKNRFILNLYLCFCNKNNSPLAHLQKYTLFAPPPPSPPLKKCMTFLFYFPWVFQPFQEKLKTLIMQNVFLFGGVGAGANKVYHGRCANGECLLFSHSSTAAVSYSKGASTSKGILKTWNIFKDKKKKYKMLTKRDWHTNFWSHDVVTAT